MRALSLSVLVLAAALASPLAQARPGHAGGGAQVAPSHGGARWAGGAYRPGYGTGHGYGGWRHGHGYGYPGYGYGFGVGLGLGYGAGWAVTAGSPWYWGTPVAVYGAPGYYPYGYWAPGFPALVYDEGVSYVQQREPEVVSPQPSRGTASHWYYCTEPAGYYPYVQQCSRPWVAVRPNAVPPAGSAPSGAPPQ
jgi:hypothetical protein